MNFKKILGTLSDLSTNASSSEDMYLTESSRKKVSEHAGHSVLDIVSKAQLDRLCKMHNDGKDFTDDKALCDKFCKYYDLEPKDKSKVKTKVMKDYGTEIKARCKELSSEKISESEERPYVCVHAKKGKYECKASSSFGATKKAAEHWGLKSTAGIDAHLADVEHTAVNESLSLKSMFEKLSAELLSENDQITMQPAQQDTQVIKKNDQVVGTVTNPNLAAQLKRGIESGEVSLDQEMNENKPFYGEEDRPDSVPEDANPMIVQLAEKYDDVIVKAYSPNEDYPSPWRAVGRDGEPWDIYSSNNKVVVGRINEPLAIRITSDVNSQDPQMEESIKDMSDDDFIEMLNKKTHSEIKEGMNEQIAAARCEGKAHGLRGQPYNGKAFEDASEARAYHEGYKEGLDEGHGMSSYSPDHGVSSMPSDPTTDVAIDSQSADFGVDEFDLLEDDLLEDDFVDENAFTAALANTNKGEEFKVGGKTFTNKTDVGEDFAFESLDYNLQQLLDADDELETVEEGISLTISKDHPNAPDSVSVSAQGDEAEELMKLVSHMSDKFSGSSVQSDHVQSDHVDSSTSETPSTELSVVDDHDEMLALMKKMTVPAAPAAVSYNDADDSGCDVCGAATCCCEDGVTENVNSMDQEQEEPDDKYKKVKEYLASLSEGDHDHVGEDADDLTEWANDMGYKGTDESFEQDIDFMTQVISGGANKPKVDQTTLPHTRTKVTESTESVNDWKKLAGIK